MSSDEAPHDMLNELRLINPYPSVDSDHGGSDQDSSQHDFSQLEEEGQSVIEVAISRAQSRLMSPLTSAAEKSAAFGELRRDGLYDGSADHHHREEAFEDIESDKHAAGTRTPESRHTEVDNNDSATSKIPSPWTAKPKLFQETDDGRKSHRESLRPRPRASSGPAGVLADLNIKRFMSGFDLPSLPRGSIFKDFSIPSLSSMLSGIKDSPDSDRTVSRSKRSSLNFTQALHRNNSDPLDQFPILKPAKKDDSTSSEVTNGTSGQVLRQRPSIHLQTSLSPSGPRQESTDLASQLKHIPQSSPSRLRRATSDGSLKLRSAVSRGSSLGDDTRWENVQEQVNSRFKAIMDSFQDSSIKLPSIPNLPSMNFGPFRADLTKKSLSSDLQYIGNVDARMLYRDVGAMTQNGQNPTTTSSTAAPGRSPKSAHHHFNGALEELTGDLVIMGGYRGSILRSAKPPHRQLWVPVKVGLNLRKVNLEVGLYPDDEQNMKETIIPSGMLTHIGPVDISRRLFKRLRACKNAQEGKLRIHDYGYDWRLSPHLLSRRLIEFLETLPSNATNVPKYERGATVIAHSVGGLVTRHAVNQRPELVAGVVYAGVPQHCVNILGPLRNGDEVLLSSRVLTAQVNFTFRTSYVLLPEHGKCFIDKHTKEEYPVDFFNVETWREYALSPLVAPTMPSLGHGEKKSLLESMSASLPSLPIPAKRSSASFNIGKEQTGEAKDTMAKAANTASTKIDDVTHPDNRTINMAMGNSHHVRSMTSSHNGNPSLSIHNTIPLPEALAYLERTLSSILAFKRALAFYPPHHTHNLYPPVAVLYGTSVPTVLGARVSGRDGIKRADAYDDLVFASGDGVCLAKAAMLPEGYEVCGTKGGRVRTERGHVGLLGDLEAVGKCLQSVLKARRRGVGCGLDEGDEVPGITVQ
ncbi:hypothetical protein MMC12_006827 [Toensbergia leucococca]|nr:hypothetical protein [Toensbergia leucococca]